MRIVLVIINIQNEELNDPYSSPKIVRARWAGHVAHMGGKQSPILGFGGET